MTPDESEQLRRRLDAALELAAMTRDALNGLKGCGADWGIDAGYWARKLQCAIDDLDPHTKPPKEEDE